MTSQDIQQVKWEVLEASERVFIDSLKQSIVNENETVIEYILDHISIPDVVLNYSILQNTCNNITILLLNEKIKLDTFVNNFLKQLHDNFTDSDLVKYVDNDRILKCNNLYKMYLLLKLSNENNFNCNSVHFSNVSINYKSAMYFVDKIFCDSAYYANFKFLNQFYVCAKNLNILPNFLPQDRTTHQQILKWIFSNLDKIKAKEPVGWRNGPDTGEWPSNDPQDYTNIYLFLKKNYGV